MAVSGTLLLDGPTLRGGSGGMATQRGDDTWGANYVFSHDGLQSDIYVIAQELADLSVSGAFATDAELYSASGQIIIDASGIAVPVASGVAASLDTDVTTNYTTAIANASGAITSDGTLVRPTITSGTLTSVQSNVTFAVSGASYIGSIDYPLAASGIYILADDGTICQLSIPLVGMVSGVAASW